MEIVVFRSQAEKAQQDIEAIYRSLVGALSGSGLGETDGMAYSIEPDSRDAYLRINIDHLERLASGNLLGNVKSGNCRFGGYRLGYQLSGYPQRPYPNNRFSAAKSAFPAFFLI